MMTIDASQWDETICDMIACQHPPCWEALRRVEKGVPRILLRIPGRDSPESGDELPTLKIVNLPFEYSQKDHIKCTESLTSISKTISNIRNTRSFYSSSTLNEALFPPMSVPSSEKNLAPGLNSRVESRTPYYTPIGFSFWRQAEEVLVVMTNKALNDLGAGYLYDHLLPYVLLCPLQVSGLDMFVDPSLDQQIHQSALIVRWIPGTRQKLLQPENSATSIKTSTQRLCVKDLALESILSLTEKQEIKRKKSSKVPTGGQPYLLHLKKNQNVRSGRPSNPTGKERNQKVGPSRKRQHRPNQLQLNPIALLQSDSALDLKNRNGTLSESKEKLVLPFIVKKAPGLNKFDSKVSMKEKVLRKTQSKEFAEKGLQSEVSAHPATSRRKTSAKSVEYKSSKNDLTVEGCDNSVHWISRSKTNYNVYCKITAKQKGAALAQDIHLAGSREKRPKGATQETEESLLPPNPPPPPPSPLLSENSENSFLDLTGS